jgi:hypothetical protein
MSARKKPFSYFAILCLVMLTAVITVLGNAIVDDSNDRLTKIHLRSLPETVRSILDQHKDVSQWFSQPPDTTLPEPMARLSEGLLRIPGVFRIKMWDKHGTILWSDNSEIIGKNFAQNHHFQVASSGEVSFNNEGIRKVENQSEQNERVVVEVYLPVYDGDRIIGVVELYESDIELSLLMARSAYSVWLSVSIAGIGLYLLMLAAYLLSQDIVTELSQKLMKD